MAEISSLISNILSAKKGETVRDSIISAVKILSESEGRSASTLVGLPISEYVVQSSNFGTKPPAINWQDTNQLTKDAVDKINFGYIQSDPTYGRLVLDNDISDSFNRMAESRRAICDAINDAWRNTPSSGTHEPDEYLVIPNTDPFSSYPDFIGRIGVGEGLVNQVEELTVTENGTYTAEEGKAYSKVTVNVGEADLGFLNITEDGTYNASSYGKDGFTFVHVAVPVVPTDDPSSSPDPAQAYDYQGWANRVGGGTQSSEEKCHVRFWGWEKYEIPTAGRYAWRRKKLYEARVTQGEDAVYVGDTPTYKDDSVFAGWNPDIKKVDHNFDTYATFTEKEIENLEISDSWEQIAKKKGVEYEIGSWKRLNVGEVYKNGKKVVIGNVKMVKIANGDTSEGTNSTWISAEAAFVSTLMWHPASFDKFFLNAEWDNTDLCEWLNGPNFMANFPQGLIDAMKTPIKKSRGYKSTGEEYVATSKRKIWVPSAKEIFSGTSLSTWPSSNEYYNYVGGVSYNSYFFNGETSASDFIYYSSNGYPVYFTGNTGLRTTEMGASTATLQRISFFVRDAMLCQEVDDNSDPTQSYKQVDWALVYAGSNSSHFTPTLYTSPQQSSSNYYSYTRACRKYFNDPSATSINYRQNSPRVFFCFSL